MQTKHWIYLGFTWLAVCISVFYIGYSITPIPSRQAERVDTTLIELEKSVDRLLQQVLLRERMLEILTDTLNAN